MGNIGAIQVRPDMDSLLTPGEKSAITDPIGKDVVDDAEELFQELVDFIKDPVAYALGEGFWLKDVEIKDKGEGACSVKIIIDGQKLKRFFPQHKPNEDDIVRKWMDVIVVHDKLQVRTVDYNPENGEVVHEITTAFILDESGESFRIEIWGMRPDGQRLHGGLIAMFSDMLFLKPLLLCRVSQKVRVRSSVDSPDTGGKSIMTESMDEFYTAEELYDTMLTWYKQQTLDAGGTVVYNSENEVTARTEVPLPVPEGFEGEKPVVTMSRNINLDPVNQQFSMHEYLHDELLTTRFVRIRSDPVRLETWVILPSGSRISGGQLAMEMRLVLMKHLSEADVERQVKEAMGQDDSYFF